MLRPKSFKDLQGIWRSGQVLGRLHDALAPQVRPGVSTQELDDFAADFLRREGAQSAFLDYRGFPRHICTSLNDEVVHGIPGPARISAGDVVSVDLGVILDDYYSDCARTYYVGEKVPEDVARLLKGTRESLYAGIAALAARQPLALVSRAIQKVLVQHGLGIIVELTGHGVGFALHEEPTVYNFDPGGRRPIVQDGWVIAIEPMASLGTQQIYLAADNWCYKTTDGSRAAHFEHTVACWEGRGWIMTDPANEESKARFGGAAGAG